MNVIIFLSDPVIQAQDARYVGSETLKMGEVAMFTVYQTIYIFLFFFYVLKYQLGGGDCQQAKFYKLVRSLS